MLSKYKMLAILAMLSVSILSPTKGMSFGNNDDSGNEANSMCNGDLAEGVPEAGSFDSQDYEYDDLSLTSSEYQGTRKRGPISHKTTESFSALQSLNPWHYVNLQAGVRPYLGPIYRGNQNEHRQRNRMTQILMGTESQTAGEFIPPDTINTCKKVIEPANGNQPNYYDPVWGRMEMDACANQYILTRARQSRVGFEAQGQLPFIRQREDSLCQPLRLIPLKEDEQEYLPSDYIYGAWRKLLVDETYLLRDGNADEEPDYSKNGVKIAYPILPPTLGQQSLYIDTGEREPSKYAFGLTCLNDITEKQIERIFDPSHPFTPRWDFEKNERDAYSFFTVIYEGNPLYYVRCAGENNNRDPIKTDILSWRAEKFHKNIMMRIITNIICYEIIIYNERVCWEDLWECDDNDEGGQRAGQCCATNYDGVDAEQMGGAARVVCGKPTIEELCAYITKPLAPINTLKMRSSSDSPPLEGYSFNGYFGKHRPYMRCWDTGLECDLRENGDQRHEEGELTEEGLKDDSGSEYAIVGAGKQNQKCTIGGGAGLSSVLNQGVRFDGNDSITSWAELKMYQARGTRQFGLTCLPKHEAVFKPGQGEEIILSITGAEYQKVVEDHSDKNLTRPQSFSWPMSWRGYVSAPIESQRFPNSSAIETGLDDALPGDILIYDREVVMSGSAGTFRNPYLAYVTETNNTGETRLKWIKALAFNHGKFPDTCGNTDTWGQGEEFTMFKTNVTAEDNKEYDEIGYDTILSQVTIGSDGRYTATKENNCDDPLISSCIEPYWDTVKRYFPIDDPRY